MASRKRRSIVALGVVVALLATGCSSSPSDLGRLTGNALVGYANQNLGPDAFENRFGSGQLAYSASWFIDPAPSGRTVPDAPYQYSEFVSDATGSYRVQTPQHYAIQTVSDVYMCATAGIVTCARSPRQDGAPNTASIAITTLRSFAPETIYEVSSDLALRVAEVREPDAWSSRKETHGNNIGVQCWQTIGPTSTAPLGFRVCYTDDDANLMASLDLTGDGTLEVDLVSYFAGSDDAQFAAPTSFKDDARIYEQLVDLFPDVPLPPDPTPDPDNPNPQETVDPSATAAPTEVPTPILPTEPDQTVPTDQTVPADQAAPTDQTVPADQAAPTDQTAPADQGAPTDQTVPTDQTDQ